MKKTGMALFLCALALLLLNLAGCGGASSSSSSSSSSPSDSPTTVLVSGVAEDGPIESARISLCDRNGAFLSRCGAQGNSRCETVSDVGGAFSLNIQAGTALVDLNVHASGGRDRATGVDFTGLEMRSPLELFTSDVSAMVISPLTTLIAALQDQGLSLAVAQDHLRAWLALPPATNLAMRPSASLDLQRHALLLCKVALEIKAVSTDNNPFSRISTQLLATNTLDDAIATLGLDVAAQARVRGLQMLLAAASTSSEAIYIYKREELIGVLAANVEQMLIDSASFDPQNANYRENLRLLAERTLQAAGSEVIPLGGTIPQRMARYLLFTYQLRTWESLTLESTVFAANLMSLASDPWIAELARSRSLYSVVSPLLLTELPGNDNQQRLTYFYGSDRSPHFLAEQLIGQVFDDAINDAVLLKIIEGKANAGLIDETRAIIATQMVQSEPKAHAYRALANALIKYNRPQEALGVLDLARDLYRQVIAAKGIASAGSADVANLLATATSYRKAGDLLNAQSLLQDIASIASTLSTNSALVYGNLITGIRNVADDFIAAGDFEAAAPLVEDMDYYSGLTPAYKGTYKLRIFNWSESAKRYAELGNSVKVEKVVAAIQNLREQDAATKTATWVYVPPLVESLYRVGKTDSALALANTIPSESTYLGAAFRLVAVYEALHDNLPSALTITDNVAYFPKDEDKLDLLTYFAANRKNPGIALALIDTGRFSEARLALEKAEGVLAGMTQSTNLARIRYGYVKVAELYALIGDFAKGEALLQSAQVVIIDDVYRVAVMVDVALGYSNLHQKSAALALLADARSLADSNPAGYRTDAIPNVSPAEAATLLYEGFIKAYEKLGEKELVHTTTVNFFLPWAQAIHTAGTVNDVLAGKECDSLLRAALYLQGAGEHASALNALTAARESAGQIAVVATRLKKNLSVIATYATVHEYEKALAMAVSLEFTTERNQAIQTLANAYIDRDDFPDSDVASIDSDGDGQPDFFHPLASAEEIAFSGLLLDDDSDGDGIIDLLDLRPLFVD